MAGRKTKFGDGTQLLVAFGEEQNAEIEAMCKMVIVEGSRGSRREMNRTEFFREGARVLAEQLRAGTYEPPPDPADRPQEAPILEVLAPPRPRRRAARR